MQTTIIRTTDGREVRCDLLTNPPPPEKKIQVEETRKMPEECREDVLNKKFPVGTKIDLEKNREMFFRFRRETRKKVRKLPPISEPEVEKEPEKIITRRQCLSCPMKFNSEGPHHRRCPLCSKRKLAD